MERGRRILLVAVLLVAFLGAVTPTGATDLRATKWLETRCISTVEGLECRIPSGEAIPDYIGDGPDGFPGFKRCWDGVNGEKICTTTPQTEALPQGERIFISTSRPLPSDAGESVTIIEPQEIVLYDLDAISPQQRCYESLSRCTQVVENSCQQGGYGGAGSAALTTCTDQTTGRTVSCCEGTCSGKKGKNITVRCMPDSQ